MKIKNLLMAFSFIGLAASCSNDDDFTSPAPTGPFDLKVKMQVAQTRSTGTAVNSGDVTDVNSVSMYLLSGDLSAVNALVVNEIIDLSEADLSLFKAGNYVINNISDEIVSVAVVANALNSDDVVAVGDNIETISAKRFKANVNAIQGTVEYPDIQNSPLFGYNTEAFKAGSNPGHSQEGNVLREVTVDITAQIARIQLYGNVKTNPETVSDFKITQIFLDNFIINNDGTGKKLQVGISTGEELASLLAPFNFFDKNPEGLEMYATKKKGVYAYHIFPQKSDVSEIVEKDRNVKLILEMSYTDLSADGVSRVEYGTLTLNAVDKNNVLIPNLDLDGGSVYTINLSKIAWDGTDPDSPFGPGDGGNTPNAAESLNVIVQVTPWNEVETVPKN